MRHVEQGQQRSPSESKYWCKAFRTKHELVGALCDEDMLDKRLDDGEVSIRVSKEFYGGMLITADMAVRVMRKVNICNIIGNGIVALAEENGFITRENIILIDGVAHAQFVKL